MAPDHASDRWQRLEAILVASWQLPAGQREAYWAGCAGGDDGLIRELRELSAAREAADAWTGDDADAGIDDAPKDRRIGPYILDALIGRGGMGVVYRAHRADGEFDQEVAVKVIGLALEIESFRERFRRERQILAGLSHPNIARLLDGGTTDEGELYLAMEFIDGVAIDRYAKERPLADRLRLFRGVAAGVQYAHQNLVVHRDIKPSNVLVDREGVPKLLDFGAAKLLAESEGAEATRLRMITVGYASPEQLRGEPASTLSDVFSLGALLFTLVAGRPPFGDDLMSRADSASGRALVLPVAIPGDLGRVVQKALALDPGERYASAEQLAEDVRRLQHNEPVLAHPPALSYRVRKFSRRHRWGLAAALAVLAMLATATAYSLREARAARDEAARARAMNRFLTSLFELPFVDATAHHDMTVRELLDLADTRVVPVLGRDPATATEVDLVLGAGFESQQDAARAKAVSERALARARDAHDIAREAMALSSVAYASYAVSDTADALARALDALGLWQGHQTDFDPEQAVVVLATAGQLLQILRPADPAHTRYLEEAVRLARLHPADVDAAERSSALQALAESYINSPGQAEEHFRQAYPLLDEAVRLDRSDPLLGGRLISSLQSWGRINRFLGHFDEDEAAQREVYGLMAKMLGPDHMATANQRAIWAFSLVGVGRAEDGYRESQAALATMRRSVPRGSFQLWTNTAAAAYPACVTRRFTECEALAREALQTLGPAPEAADPRVFEAKAYLGLALSGEGRNAEAAPLLAAAIEFYQSRNRSGPFQALLQSTYDAAKTGR